jgi:hypothetical protein
MAKVRSLRRRRPTRVVGRKIIIVCEGEKTEPEYFEAIRISLRLPTLKVHVVHPNGTDPLTIVLEAIAQRSIREMDKSWTTGDSAWAVYDGDEHQLINPHNWNDAIQLAARKKINLAVSNPCFELWYVLHFQPQTANLSRQDAIRVLRKHIPDYQKSKILWPVPLRPITEVAIQRARQLAEQAARDLLVPHTNPCTGVGELVVNLLELEKEVIT